MPTIQELLQQKAEKTKQKSERAELVKYFVDILRNKDDKPFKPQFIAIKLSHIPTKDLYFVQSVFKDNLKRRGLVGASKEFWWSIKYNENEKRTN